MQLKSHDDSASNFFKLTLSASSKEGDENDKIREVKRNEPGTYTYKKVIITIAATSASWCV
jgi:hypothetical protein